ncbi:1,3-propanediol dehydrogenase [Phycisphaerae bacterium RAS1]|nr:1,3-propanediol dehydrogenase [Phycisphaerae bacterium RAS1]
MPDLSAMVAASSVRVVLRAGALERLGELARGEGPRRVLLVTDPGLIAVGHIDRAVAALKQAAIVVCIFDGVRENPTTAHVAAGLAAARDFQPDMLIALGGGSAMDCAKGINLLHCCGGKMADYRGDPPAEVLASRKPLLPMILIPTTAGTGSEAQSFALISDADTRVKMACSDRRPPAAGGLRPRLAILDPELTRTAPRAVAAAVGIDAISHAVETAGCRVRTEASLKFSEDAWRVLSGAFERSMRDASDDQARMDMLLGAHLAGCAIEASMLGAAHACANPLTARLGIVHGVAVGLMLPHVIRFNAESGVNPYAALDADAERLARRIEGLWGITGAPPRLSAYGVARADLDELAQDAAAQWTAGFNPRPVRAAELRGVYEAAL